MPRGPGPHEGSCVSGGPRGVGTFVAIAGGRHDTVEWPPGESYKCYSEFVGMDVFLQQFIAEQQTRIQEPENGYNAEDLGMKIVAPLINDALEG
jgi:hypothetical protein